MASERRSGRRRVVRGYWTMADYPNGTVAWDLDWGEVRLYDAATRRWTAFPEPSGYELNEMYLAQTRHFLDCLDGTARPLTPLSTGLQVLHVLEAVKRSCAEGRFIDLSSEETLA